MKPLLVLLSTLLLAFAQEQRNTSTDTTASRSRSYNIEHMTWPQIDSLNRERTLFVLPVGAIEEHGPHLPVGADTIGVMYEATQVCQRLKGALAGWNVVLMPAVHYGHAGANQIGGILVHPGTYSIRQSTLTSLLADIGGQIAQSRFKWIFVMNGHGAPPHNIAINNACDFVSETFNVTMLHLTALFKADAAIHLQGKKIAERYFSRAEIASFGMDVHAGVGETSAMLALRPDLVDPGYKRLPSRAGHSLQELRSIALQPGWPGYLSSPAKANATYGRAVEEWWVQGFTDLILRAIRGENMFKVARVPDADFETTALAAALRSAAENDRAFEQKLARWLEQRKKE
jgi:creatinine amidohydrolase/Fe(II)-dependent formamide hydrolase-like protein